MLDLVSFRKGVTGIGHTVFVAAKGRDTGAARITLAIDPADSIDPRGGETASVAIDGEVAAGSVPPALLRQAQRFIELNREVLLAYWNYEIDTEQLRRGLRSI
jgi:hypothetical protein